MSTYKKVFLFLFIIQMQIAKADVFRILDNEKEALQCRIDMMIHAQTELLVSTYIIRQDDVGFSMMQLMIESAAKGVKVRLILDSFGKELPDELLDFLAEKGVEIRTFNNVRLFEFHTLLDRMHEKVLITDTEHVIVGGRNLTKDYFKLEPTDNFLDREIYAKGKKAVADLRYHFYDMWNHPKLTQKATRLILDDKKRDYWQKRLSDAWASLQQKTPINPKSSFDWSNIDSTTEIHATYDNFVHQKNGKIEPSDRKNRRCTRLLIALIDSAKYTVDIENPYFHPTKRWLTAINSALKRGVKIRLLTNSECTNDVLVMQSVYRRSRPKYLKMGIQIWEYEGNAVLHTKSFTIDSSITVVGSYNLHSVSEKYDTEVCLWVHDKAIAAQNLCLMERYSLSAKQIPAVKPNLSIRNTKKNTKCPNKSVRSRIYMHSLAWMLNWYM